MPIRALSTSCTFTSYIKTANMCSVSFVIWRCSLKLQNSVTWTHFSIRGFIIYASSCPAVMFLCKVFPIHVALWNGIIGINGESCITHLNWQPILEIQKTNLTNIFQLTACLANLGFLKPCITAWPPPENCEGTCTDLALLVIVCSCHTNVRVIAEA